MTRLSLSGRLIEVQYRTCELSVPEFLRFAHRCGYEAVELRATQITGDTTLAEVRVFRQTADELGLIVSCCTPPGVTPDGAGLRRLEEFVGLRAVGFDGYVTLNEPKPKSMKTEAFAKQMHDELRRWT